MSCNSCQQSAAIYTGAGPTTNTGELMTASEAPAECQICFKCMFFWLFVAIAALLYISQRRA